MVVSDSPPLQLADLDYRDLLDMVSGYTIIVDSQHHIRWLNRAPMGRRPHEYIDADILQLVIDAHRPIVADALARVAMGEPVIELEVQSAKLLRWFSARVVGIVRHGAIPGVFVHALDVDDAKRMETELAIQRARRLTIRESSSAAPEEVSRRRLELMCDALPVLISYVDSRRRYRYNNAAYEGWFGVSREQLRGRTVEEVLGSAAYENIRPYVDAALSGRAVRFESTNHFRIAGLRRTIAHYVPDVSAEGEVVGFYVLVEDVSAQREAEATLEQREEQLRQVQKSEALGRLAGGIAHDFGNLLMTIVTGCTAVSELVGPDTAPARMVALIERAARRGTSLTQQLLAFSRGSEFPIGPVEVDAVIGDMVVLLDRLLESRIELEVDLGANAWIRADAGQIQRVLMNLAFNARDAMPDGGHLRVVTTLVNRETGPQVLLSVSDTGIGMDPATRARIFEPFFTTKPSGQGTGLGLSTVYGIVRQAEGHIEVESAPGLGTMFRLYFPTCSPGSSTAQAD
jgi:PAS domain S-box-containing protein